MEEKSFYYQGTSFSLSEATQEEQNFSFSNEGFPIDKACIGHLRGDFGVLGGAFHTTWFDHTKALKTDVFTKEFDNVINALKEDGLLASRPLMLRKLGNHAHARITQQFRPEFAFRMSTDEHLYFLRCIPQKGDYNFYCYAFNKEAFYEIQREEKHMPRWCWGRLESTNEIIRIEYGALGHHPDQKSMFDKETTQKIVDELNEEIGISKAQAAAMEHGCILGWNIPAADPKNYDDHGFPVKPQKTAKEKEYER